jgi:hypothetical protein
VGEIISESLRDFKSVHPGDIVGIRNCGLPAPWPPLQCLPGCKRSFGLRRILPDTTDRETIQANLLGYGDVRIRCQQVEDAGELLAAVAGLPSKIDALGGLRVRDAGLLGELGGLGLGPVRSRS